MTRIVDTRLLGARLPGTPAPRPRAELDNESEFYGSMRVVWPPLAAAIVLARPLPLPLRSPAPVAPLALDVLLPTTDACFIHAVPIELLQDVFAFVVRSTEIKFRLPMAQ